MKEKELTYQEVPTRFPLCFNHECAKNACCMHYQAGLLLPDDCHHGPAIYPTAWRNGECKYFREKRLVLKAWGFTHLYDNLPRKDKSAARQRVMSYISSGCGPYYRYHHGERLLSPELQEAIMNILATFGSTDGLRFDHYVEDWDFGL